MTSTQPSLKQKTIHEFWELTGIFLYLACFFCSLEAYTLLLLNSFHIKYLNYGFAVINALVIAKVILIGEYAKLGRRHENKPLFVSALYKAVLYMVLVFIFHLVEEEIKRLLHGTSFAGAFQESHIDHLIGRSIVVFCVFIPLFAFRELRRVLGEETFAALFFGSGDTREPAIPK